MTTPDIDRLTALDRLMLAASEMWPQDVGAVVILDGGVLLEADGRFRIEAVRAAIGARLDLVPRFRQLIHTPGRGLGGPLWVDALRIDLVDHVRELPLEPPAGEPELLAAVERLRRRPLEALRPMWELWFLPGLADGRVGCFVRIHHTIADGMAAMLNVAALFDASPGSEAAPAVAVPAPWSPRPWPTNRALFIDNARIRVGAVIGLVTALARPRASVRRVAEAWPALRELVAEPPGTRTSIGRMVGPSRTFALIRARHADVRAAGRAHDATVNDVLLAVLAGGLRALLIHRGEPVRGTTLRVYVPVSLRRRLRGLQQGNLIAQMAVPLHLDEADSGRRLRAISAETDRRKARVRTSLGVLLSGGRWIRRLMLVVVMRQRVNVTTASLPGPKVAHSLAGARIAEVFPLLPLIADETLGVGALSYAGSLGIGIAADEAAFPDLDILVAAMEEDLAALVGPHVAVVEKAEPAVDESGAAPTLEVTAAR